MTKIFVIYITIGLFLSPLIYSNNAEEYRDTRSTGYGWGKAIGSSLYWPSYLFSIEPEVNGDSLESFQKSIIEILNYRKHKLFTGNRSQEDGAMIIRAIGNCLALEGLGSKDLPLLYERTFVEGKSSKELDRIRNNIMKKMDGHDFSEVIEEGAKCANILNRSRG